MCCSTTVTAITPRSTPSSSRSSWGSVYMTYLHDYLQGQAGRAAAADERGDLVPVDLVGDGFSEGPGDPEPDQLPGPPVVDERLLVVDALVVHLPSPGWVFGSLASFGSLARRRCRPVPSGGTAAT